MYVKLSLFDDENVVRNIDSVADKIHNSLSLKNLLLIFKSLVNYLNDYNLTSQRSSIITHKEQRLCLGFLDTRLLNLLEQFKFFDLSKDDAYAEGKRISSPVAFWSKEGRQRAESEGFVTLSSLVIGVIVERLDQILNDNLKSCSEGARWTYIKPMWVFVSKELGKHSVHYGRDLQRMPVAMIPNGIGSKVTSIFAQHELRAVSETCSDTEFDALLVHEMDPLSQQWVERRVSESGSFPKDLEDIPQDKRQKFLKLGLSVGIFSLKDEQGLSTPDVLNRSTSVVDKLSKSPDSFEEGSETSSISEEDFKKIVRAISHC